MSKLTLFLHLPSNRLRIAAVVSYPHQNFPLAAAAILESEKTLGSRGRGWLHARAGGSIDTLCMCPLRAETPLYLCSTALQYSPRLFPLLLSSLEKHFSDLPVIIQTNVSLMSDKKVVVSLNHPHPTLPWLILQRCIVDVDRWFSGPKVIASESEKGRKNFSLQSWVLRRWDRDHLQKKWRRIRRPSKKRILKIFMQGRKSEVWTFEDDNFLHVESKLTLSNVVNPGFTRLKNHF